MCPLPVISRARMWASSRVHETVFQKMRPSAKSSGSREYSPSRSSSQYSATSTCFYLVCSPALSNSTSSSMVLPDCLERGTADASEMRVLDEVQVRRNQVRLRPPRPCLLPSPELLRSCACGVVVVVGGGRLIRSHSGWRKLSEIASVQ